MEKKQKQQSIDKTELVWPGKRKEVERVELPFQTIETINLPRGKRQEDIFSVPVEQQRLIKDGKKQLTLDGQDADWKNRLIWGDNLLVMGSLLKDFAGKINLIYIDPPFATGDDFSFTVNIGDQAEVTKEPSALEVKAYRDTWGKGMQSYLQMMYDRLVLMKELLADDGSIYVHLSWQVGHYIKTIMDGVFGKERFINDISWRRGPAHNDPARYGHNKDMILFYSRNESYAWNQQYGEFSKEHKASFNKKDKKGEYTTLPLHGPAHGQQTKPWRDVVPPRGRIWAYKVEQLEQWDKEGKIEWSRNSVPRLKRYIHETQGAPLQEIWTDVPILLSHHKEHSGYSTQKPEALLVRIIKSSSNKGNLIADFFCGSGTTGVVAEKLGRRWIMADLGRFAVHTTRKRLLDMNAKAFLVQNLGKYERHRWARLNGRYKDYAKFILELYHAESVDGFAHLHGKKAKGFVRVGAVDAPVTLSEIREALEECKENKIKKLDVLGWEWEMGLHDLIKEEAEKYGVKLGTFQIPREVMELSVADAQGHDVQFFELAYLDIGAKVKDKKTTITLKDFIIPNPELLPEEVKGKVKNWSDFIDYWAVDWMFNQHKEEAEEDDTFHNMNQRYRTRKEPRLELSMDYQYKKPGKYNILVKVIDIFGNDTTKLVEVKA